MPFSNDVRKSTATTRPEGSSEVVQLKSQLHNLDFAAQEALLKPSAEAGDVRSLAATGTRGGGGALPYLAPIQAAFGHHDVSQVQSYAASDAVAAGRAMGAAAYATGDRVAFAKAPDLHTAAHEAAHVVQQRAGASPSGGVGAVGDRHEQHADRVADAVVAGRSAAGLLDEYASSDRVVASSAPVQMLIAMTDDQLTQPLQQNDPLEASFQAIGQHIATYNIHCENDDLAEDARIQLQLDQLRVLDRACYAALGQMSATQLELTNDARAQVLHQLLQESEQEHVQLVDRVAGDQNLRDQVNPFAPVTGDQDDLDAQATKALWTRIVTGQSKLIVTGPQQYQGLVRSWLTKLMDTKQGRRLLRFLDNGDQNQIQSNTYIGQQLDDLPDDVRVVANNPGLNDPNESVAQPLMNSQTQVTRAHGHKDSRVSTAEEMNDAVLNGRQGVRMNHRGYDFGQSSGSFVSILGEGTLRGVSGVERQNHGQTETPEIYQPDWILLGHELGHAANMKAGATTEGRLQMDNDTDVFARHMSGEDDRERRQNQWFGGSEEYINIVGNENRLRQQGGLDPRGAHTSPRGREQQRLLPQITAAFNETGWGPLLNPHCLEEVNRFHAYNQQKAALLGTVQQNPYAPNLLQQAQTLGDDMMLFLQQQVAARDNARAQVTLRLNEGAWLAQLQPGRPYDQLFRAQYDQAKAEILRRVDADPNQVVAPLQMAQDLGAFAVAWVALTQAHGQAGLGRQVMYKAWWEKAKDSVHNIGDVIIAQDNGRYQRKLDRVVDLTGNYG